MKTITIEIECSSCGGTGLYIGFAESEGAAVVCKMCDGTGKTLMSYKPFVKRNPPSNKIWKVFQTNIGYGLNKNSQGGMPIEDWNANKPFPKGSEDREHVCPAWYYQSADYKKKPSWVECQCNAFVDCRHFSNKDGCWKRWDKEFGK
jgi:hypothetical protein